MLVLGFVSVGHGQKANALHRIRPQLAVLDSGGEEGGERCANALPRCQGRIIVRYRGEQLSDVGWLDVGELPRAPAGQSVGFDAAPVEGPRPLRQPPGGAAGVGLDPVLEVLLEPRAGDGSTVTRVPVPLRLPRLGQRAERACVLASAVAPHAHVGALTAALGRRVGSSQSG